MNEANLLVSCGMYLILVLILEGICWWVHKDKAMLFLRIKTAKLQEEQLLNLLDSMPDKVLISELCHESKPVPIYTNRAMRMLFGGDALNKDMRKNLMGRRIFTELNQPGNRRNERSS